MRSKTLPHPTTCFALVVALATVPCAATSARAATTVDDRSVEALAQRLCRLLADPEPSAAIELRERVAAGVPPGALMVLLDAFRAAPRAELAGMVRELATYRRTEVRARAFAAWAALDGLDADAAIAAAADDLERPIRKLAVALAQVYGSATADAIVRDLLERDDVLRAEIEADSAPIVPEGPT
jgi:hypothetical protein